MEKVKFVGNCADIIDWNTVVEEIIDKPGKLVTADRSKWKMDTNPVYGELVELWEKANFNFDAIKWINYYPGEDFDNEVIVKLENLLKVKTIKVWLARINPGWCTPWHWDTDDNEVEWNKLGNTRRFMIFIDPPAVGHMLAMEDHCFYNEAVGNIYEWSDYKLWHAGTNVGLAPKFILHWMTYD